MSRAVVSRVSLGLELLDAKPGGYAKSVRLAPRGLQKASDTDAGLLEELTVEAVLRAAHAQAPESVLAAQLPSRGYTVIANGLSSLVNLRTLDLACNKLASLLPLAGLPSLCTLSLQGNCLRALPPLGGASFGAAAGFQALEELDLSFNTLEAQALSFLQALPRLRQLDISGNGLTTLGPMPSLTGFAALRSLKAASNRLGAEAVGQLQWLPLLQQLDLSRNEIASVATLGDPLLAFSQLKVLDLSYNCLPADAAELLGSLDSHPRLILLGNRAAKSRRGSLAAGSQRGAGASPRKPSLVQSSTMVSIEEAPAPSFMASRAKAAAAASALAGGSSNGYSRASGAGGHEQPVGERSAAQRAAQEKSGSSQAGAGEGSWQEGHIPADFLADSALGSLWSVAEVSGQVLGEMALAGGGSGGVAGNHAAGQQAAPGSGGKGTEEGEEEEEEAGEALYWTDSWGQSDSTEGSEGDALWGVEDPTIRLALALGLDPLHLSWFQPPAQEGGDKFPSISATVNALKFALQHPPTAAGGWGPAGNHLKGTKSTEAKRRSKFQGLLAASGASAAGGAAAPPEVQAGRLAAVDALLAAMKKRLRKVQAQVWGEISATFELCEEEGTLAGRNTSAAPTPLPGATSPVAERSQQQRSVAATPSRLSMCGSHSRPSAAGQRPAAGTPVPPSASPSRLSYAGQAPATAISPSHSRLSMAGHTLAVTPPPPST